MALLFLDSCEDRVGADIKNRYSSSANTPTTSSTGVRTGTKSMLLSGNSMVGNTFANVGGSGATIIFGFSIYMGTLPTSTNVFLEIFPNSGVSLQLTMDTAGNIKLVVNGQTTGAAGTVALTTGTLMYVQVKVSYSGTTTTCSLVTGNGAVATSSAMPGATSAMTAPLRWEFKTPYTMYFDDFLVFDGTGTRNNDLPGQPKVECIRPTGAGSTTNLGLSGAGANYGAVADTTPDNDASYVSSATAGDRDTYATGNLAATTGYVAGMQVNMFARKDDASTRQIAACLRIGATNYDLQTVNESTVYQNLVGIAEVNPANGLGITIADVNAMEIGVTIKA